MSIYASFTVHTSDRSIFYFDINIAETGERVFAHKSRESEGDTGADNQEGELQSAQREDKRAWRSRHLIWFSGRKKKTLDSSVETTRK